MTPLRAIIADDEPLALDALRAAVLAAGDVVIVDECRDGLAVVGAVQRGGADVLFLDISMPRLDGLTAVSMFASAEAPAIVFVTAHDKHAVRAFELGAADYLLKPFDRARVALAIARVRERRAAPISRAPTRPLFAKHFLASSGGKLIVIRAEDIEYLAAADNYVRLGTPDGTPLLRQTLKMMAEQLDPAEFVRVHRSYLVRLSAIFKLAPKVSGDYLLILRGGSRVPMSRNYRDDVLRRLAGR
jgi:two-component system LytT family response regulator